MTIYKTIRHMALDSDLHSHCHKNIRPQVFTFCLRMTSIVEIMALKRRMATEWLISEDMEGSGSGLIGDTLAVFVCRG
jgi:hypothetical protein